MLSLLLTVALIGVAVWAITTYLPMPQVFRTAIRHPLVRSGALITAFGGNDQSLRIGKERLSNQLLAHLRAIGISRINEIDA